MSFQVSGVCYPTKISAAMAQASQALPVSSGHFISIESVSESLITFRASPIDGTAAHTVAVPFVPIDCQLMDLGDGLLLGWAVAGVWISTYCVMYLARVIRGETGENYGTA